ncbi:MAG: tripartite tricarboxylate transporter receptor family protein [Betaproteobacteria bacterium]|jgi:tripartite-type tricarboxylate transporter receptor subunit TctC|nr:tripartite tricarboxylate transporter receptor family protein [Betaproteobacteria bacterium]
MKRGIAAPFCTALAFAAAACIVQSAHSASSSPRLVPAEDYPHKPIRFIDAFVPGGATDVMARIIGQKITEKFGQQVIVDNRAGAGGNVGAEIAAKATPDGYTLLMANVPSLAPSPSLYPKLGFDVLNDFAYISVLAGGSYVIIMNPTVPAKSVPELIALAKAKPGQFRYGSSGVGGPVHLAGELLKHRAGVDILHVPYKGAGPIITAVITGEVQFGYPSLAGALSFIKQGRVVAIAVTSAKRAKALPDVPTIAESGYPGYDITPWYGMAAPAATPRTIVNALAAELARTMQQPDVQTAFANLGLEATSSTPERFRAIVRDAIATSSKIIKDVGIKVE